MNFFQKNPDWHSYFELSFVYLDGAVVVDNNLIKCSTKYVVFSSEMNSYDYVLFYADKIVFSNKIAFKKYQFLFPTIKMNQFNNYFEIRPEKFDLTTIYRIYLFPKRKEDVNQLIKMTSNIKKFHVSSSKQFHMYIIKGNHDKYFSIKDILFQKPYVFFGDGFNDEVMFLNSLYSVNIGDLDKIKKIADVNISSKNQIIEEIDKWIK